jgi:hypothetical protein
MHVVPLDDAPGWLRIELSDAVSITEPEDGYLNNRILEALIRAEIPILGFEAKAGRLRDVFMDLTEETIK